jgi:hypothetical protein
VTVRASDLALLDLLDDALPIPVGQRLADRERLRPGIEVIELEHHSARISGVRLDPRFERMFANVGRNLA